MSQHACTRVKLVHVTSFVCDVRVHVRCRCSRRRVCVGASEACLPGGMSSTFSPFAVIAFNFCTSVGILNPFLNPTTFLLRLPDADICANRSTRIRSLRKDAGACLEAMRGCGRMVSSLREQNSNTKRSHKKVEVRTLLAGNPFCLFF